MAPKGGSKQQSEEDLLLQDFSRNLSAKSSALFFGNAFIVVAQKREDAVSKEVTRKLSEADNRKMSRKEKDERILWKKNEVADYEATTFSIFYNNTLFLVLVIVASFFILKNFNPTVYPFEWISFSRSLETVLRFGFDLSEYFNGSHIIGGMFNENLFPEY
ncbi:signal sequence receptor, gamma isoform 2-like protein [Camelus ferus]|nr:signal sequence receptor, gamma isoform 2-like protein [Camelus ferus]